MTLLKKRESNFPSIWEDLFNQDFFRTPTLSQAGITVPAVNIKETAKSYCIEMAAAGMKKNDFHINVERNMISISADTSSENITENQEEKYTRKEYSYHSFERSFTLPDSCDTSKIEATYKDGILIIDIPKKEDALKLPQTIKVT